MSLNNKSTEALREKLDREKHHRRGKPLNAELLEIGKRCAAHIKRPLKSGDHAACFMTKTDYPAKAA
jgi:hypothetical protein